MVASLFRVIRALNPCNPCYCCPGVEHLPASAAGEFSGVSEFGFHGVDPANVTAGSAGMTEKRLIGLQGKQ